MTLVPQLFCIPCVVIIIHKCRVYIVPFEMPELKPYRGNYYLWHYVPSPIAGSTVAGSFLILTCWVVWRMIRTRTKFSIPFVIGGVCKYSQHFAHNFCTKLNSQHVVEVLGYLARVWSTYATDNLIPYSIQAVLILIAPALFAASVYMVLSRVIRSVNAEHHSIIRATWLTRIFVLTDVLSFLVQCGGSSILVNEDINPDVGKAVILVGLFIQIIAFGLFILAAVFFHVRNNRNPTTTSKLLNATWRQTMLMLYLVNGLIMFRSIFRVIEYSMGMNSYLFRNEWPLYTFDGEFMLLAMFCYAFWFPGSFNTKLSDSDVSLEPVRKP